VIWQQVLELFLMMVDCGGRNNNKQLDMRDC